MPGWSQTFTFLDGEWIEGNKPFIGARTHAFWLGSSVFDGARAFEGVTPDLDKHCARLNRSAKTMWLKPIMSEAAMVELAREGVRKFGPGAELYIRPMYWAERGGAAGADGRFDHPLGLYEAARGHHADRRQGRLPLSQQCARAARGAGARLRQLSPLRHARKRRRARDRERVHGQGWRRLDADGERNVPQRRHPPARSQIAARRRRGCARSDLALFRLRRGRRNLRCRQFRQGDAGPPHRRTRPAARAVLSPRPSALLGIRPFSIERSGAAIERPGLQVAS